MGLPDSAVGGLRRAPERAKVNEECQDVGTLMSGIADAVGAAVRAAHEYWVGPGTGLPPEHTAGLGTSQHQKDGTRRQSRGRVLNWGQILLTAEETADVESQVR